MLKVFYMIKSKKEKYCVFSCSPSFLIHLQGCIAITFNAIFFASESYSQVSCAFQISCYSLNLCPIISRRFTLSSAHRICIIRTLCRVSLVVFCRYNKEPVAWLNGIFLFSYFGFALVNTNKVAQWFDFILLFCTIWR